MSTEHTHSEQANSSTRQRFWTVTAVLVGLNLVGSFFYLDYYTQENWEALNEFKRDHHRTLQGKISQALTDFRIEQSYDRAQADQLQYWQNRNARNEEAVTEPVRDEGHLLDSQLPVAVAKAITTTESLEETELNHLNRKSITSLAWEEPKGFLNAQPDQIQETHYPDPVGHRHQWFVGAFAGPEIASDHPHYALRNQQESFVFHNNLTRSQATSISYQATTGFTAGLTGGLQLGKHFELESGLRYHRWQGVSTTVLENVHQNEIVYTEWVEVSGGSDPSGSEPKFSPTQATQTLYSQRNDTLRTNFTQSFIEWPVIVRYGFGKNQWKFHLSTGLSTTFLSRHQLAIYSYDQQATVQRNESSNVGQISALIGGNIDYELSPAMHIRVEPQYRYGLHSFDPVLDQKTINFFGVNAGLIYRF